MRKLAAILLIASCLTAMADPATDGQVSVWWTMPTENLDGTPLTDLAGAKVYYGTSSSNYTQVVDAGLTNAFTVTWLVFGTMYYFNGTAYSTAGLESDFCNEVAKSAKRVPPLRGMTIKLR